MENERSVAETAAGENESAGIDLSVRAVSGGYLAVLLLGSYLSALLFYLELDAAGAAAFALSWIGLPFLAMRDRIAFDGRRLARTGILFNIIRRLSGRRTRLRLGDVEQIDTQATRTLRRDGRVHYRYRTTVRGRGLAYAFSSASASYPEMLARLLAELPDEVMDLRTLDMRTYLGDPKEVQMKASFAGIPGSDVLESSLRSAPRRNRSAIDTGDIPDDESSKADYLHRLGNELRVAGFLLQSIEAFRRALHLRPRDPRILLDLARGMHSYAGSERSEKLRLRSIAALRLSSRYAGEDAGLIARIGEAFSQFGRWRLAESAFRRAIESGGDCFLAFRGLAEAAMREGKLAHVIHQFDAANIAAGSNALRRWASGEAAYFARLNSDDEFLEMESSRVQLADSLGRYARSGFFAAAAGALPLLYGLILDDPLAANVGWAVTGFGLTVWISLIGSTTFFEQRFPHDIELDD